MSNNQYVVRATTVPGGHGEIIARGVSLAFDGSQADDLDAPGPADLLASALAACVLKNVERFSKILPFEYRSASVEVTLGRQDAPPKIIHGRYQLRIETDEPAVRCDLLHRNVGKFGTISNTLALAFELEGELTVVRASGETESIPSSPR
jgi:uncharacterized OsmC-like protein